MTSLNMTEYQMKLPLMTEYLAELDEIFKVILSELMKKL